LAPLLKRLNPAEKLRNRRGSELVFGHKDDKALFHAVQLAQAAFEAGHTGLKQTIRGDRYLFGFLEGFANGGSNRSVDSPIEGLPDVEESHAISAQFTDPEKVPHSSKMLPGIQEMPLVVNASDMDEETRMKGFGGEPAKRMIMQALGKDSRKKPSYKDIENRQKRQTPVKEAPVKTAPVKIAPARAPARAPAGAAASASAPAMAAPVQQDAGHWGDGMFDYEEDESEFADPLETKVSVAPAPPAGTKVIRVRPTERKQAAPPAAPKGFQAVRRPGQPGRGAPY